MLENLQEIEDEGEIYESIEDIWPDYPSKDDFFFKKKKNGFFFRWKKLPVRFEDRTGVSDFGNEQPFRAAVCGLCLNILLQSAPVRSPRGFETFPLLHKNFRIGFDRLSLYRSFASNNSPAGISTV